MGGEVGAADAGGKVLVRFALLRWGEGGVALPFRVREGEHCCGLSSCGAGAVGFLAGSAQLRICMVRARVRFGWSDSFFAR